MGFQLVQNSVILDDLERCKALTAAWFYGVL